MKGFDRLFYRSRQMHAESRSRALLSVKGSITASDWRRYTSTLRLFDLYPGVHGAGVVYPVRTGEIETFRRDHPGVNVHPLKGCVRPPPSEAGYAHFVIGIVEPLAPNAAAIGLDLASETNRQQAGIQSMDTGEAWVTRQIQLVQDNRSRPGFLLYLPVYANGSPTGTVAERRAAFQCWIYAPFIFEEFVRNVLNEKKREIDYFVFDGATTKPASLIYASTGAHIGEQPLGVGQGKPFLGLLQADQKRRRGQADGAKVVHTCTSGPEMIPC